MAGFDITTAQPVQQSGGFDLSTAQPDAGEGDQETLTNTGNLTSEGRPIYKNNFGDFVSERTITENVPELGGFINLPTVYDGVFVNPDEAIQRVVRSNGVDPVTGRKLQVFSDVESAVNSARDRSGVKLSNEVRQPEQAPPFQGTQQSEQMIPGQMPVQEPEPGFFEGQIDRPMSQISKVVKEGIIGPAEAAGSMAGNVVAEGVAGLAGLGTLVYDDAEQAESNIKSVRDALHLIPPTKEGQAILKKVAEVLTPVGESVKAAREQLGDATLDATDSEVLASIAQTVPDAAMMALGLKMPKVRVKPSKKGREPLVVNGKPNKELAANLKEEGIVWDSLKVETKDLIAKQNKNANPADIARLARFKEINAPALKGEITKNFEQRKLEQGLMESGSEATAEPIRQTALRASEAIKDELASVAGKGGADVGSTVKEALSANKTSLKAARKEAYGKLTENASKFEDVKIMTDDIANSLPSKGEMREFQGMYPAQSKALDDLLVEFGVESDVLKKQAFTESAGEITPLNISNFESFRKRLNNIQSTDQTGYIGRITNKVKDSLDNEIGLATKTIESKGGDIGQMAKEARQSNVKLMSEFDPKVISSRLIDPVKRGSVQPKIEPSKVYQTLMSPAAPIEGIEKVARILNKSGSKGKEALKDLQGRAVLDLLDSAYSSQSRQIGGTRTFGAGAYSRQFEKMEPKLEILFKNNKQGLARLRRVYKIAQDKIPPGGAVPKGSAGYFIDALNKMGVYSIAAKVPFARELLEIVRKGGESATIRRKVEASIKASPSKRKALNTIKNDYPQLYRSLGIEGIATTTNQKVK